MPKGRPKGSKTKVSQSQKQNSKVGNIHININSGTSRKRNNVHHQQQHQIYQPAPNYSSAQMSGHQYNKNVDFIPINTPTITNDNSEIKNIMSEIMGRITNVKPEGTQTVINNYGSQMDPMNIDTGNPVLNTVGSVALGATELAASGAILAGGGAAAGYAYRKFKNRGNKVDVPDVPDVHTKADVKADIVDTKADVPTNPKSSKTLKASKPGKIKSAGKAGIVSAAGGLIVEGISNFVKGVGNRLGGNRLGGTATESKLTKKSGGNTYTSLPEEEGFSSPLTPLSSVASTSSKRSNSSLINPLQSDFEGYLEIPGAPIPGHASPARLSGATPSRTKAARTIQATIRRKKAQTFEDLKAEHQLNVEEALNQHIIGTTRTRARVSGIHSPLVPIPRQGATTTRIHEQNQAIAQLVAGPPTRASTGTTTRRPVGRPRGSSSPSTAQRISTASTLPRFKKELNKDGSVPKKPGPKPKGGDKRD